MEYPNDLAAKLVAEATKGHATVQKGHLDELELRFHHGTTLTFTLKTWTEQPGEIPQPHTLWILRNPTDRTLKTLRKSRESYVSLGGAVRILGPGTIVDRAGLKVKKPPLAPQRRSAFSDRSSLVPRWLFRLPTGSEWLVTTLAERCGVSASVASYAITDLEERELLATHRRGRERWVGDLDHVALIHHWTAEYSWRRNYSVRAHAPVGSPMRFLRRLIKSDFPRWAATLHTGAQLYAPHAPLPHLQLYVDLPRAALHDLIADLGWVEDAEGSIELFTPHYRRSIWQWVQSAQGIPVVSHLQMILDLWQHPLRGREQADLLLEKHVQDLK